MKPTLLILAAGMGSRYGGLKQVDPVGPNGEAIIDYSIYDAIRSRYGKVVFVIRESFAEAFKELFDKKLEGKIEVEYVFQELDNIPKGIPVNPERTKPWGTGHAVLVAKDAVKEPFVVINADDFYGPTSYQLLVDYFKEIENANGDNCSMVGYGLEHTLSEHGHVSRGVCEKDENDFLQTVVERTQIERIDGKIITKIDENSEMELTGKEVVSMNTWGFSPSFFNQLEIYFAEFIKANADNPKAEFYIPTVVNELINKGEITLKVLESKDRWFGVTYKEDKESAVASINALIADGVYPEKLW
ncbi:sugar phosphate nucleotidyltransferase [Desulfosarcina sp.]|nr:sugar phosphate nucleotidyltransferase [Desulfosarcina sp.]